ncbi:redox-regulated ATPase YchF [Buchnera aphidicola (Muscaphis stroyani)]|uniref:Ribosome-binding ATPase YchF n=1 Tax=Buchnera aphidicola (Muscaphis stroyani) TaxID=1241869 RepID=A0A4D6Y4C9_9GAMM|nr:redox-regulated ATPase YchF [Buchnera aphidicola]QCI24282.1 redox-regulated ATPase YchF [Buchnera aphidicola (Muscaphis stroyani)]
MSFKCGIIGLPNVGKSTLFNTLTKGNSVVANFPFCTIKPNIGIVSVPDTRIDELSKIINPKKIIRACIEFVDIAGLVKGASKGEGLGNQFLNTIRESDTIAHVVRCFKDRNITHIYNQINPEKDVSIINNELILSDFETCNKAIFQLKKNIKINNQDKEKILITLKKCMDCLNNFKMIKNIFLDDNEKKLISHFRFLTLKPTMYIANIDDSQESLIFLNSLKEIAKKENSKVIPISALLELDLSKMDNLDQKEFMKEFNIKQLGLNNIIIQGYQLLNLITFFTAGKKEIHAWSIPNGSTSLQAADKIHSDFKKGFIRSQIIKFSDFLKYKNEVKIRELGKFKTEGKDYLVQDGDIIHFLFNV